MPVCANTPSWQGTGEDFYSSVDMCMSCFTTTTELRTQLMIEFMRHETDVVQCGLEEV